jgi:3-deoxy-D-manno-octulosonic-acid transferase
MNFIYTLSILLYSGFIRVFALFNDKAKLWVKGREHVFGRIKTALKENEQPIVWIHCASLGEFEQGRVLIEKIKTETNYKIVLTFFSPSGYEVRKNYAHADYIFYLPSDTPWHAKKWLALIKPEMAVFVKYEFWHHYLRQLQKTKTPTYLISGIFRGNHYLSKWFSKWFRKNLRAFHHFYLQDTNSQNILSQLGYNNSSVCGDTRFDRVWELSQNVKAIPALENFIGGKKAIIAGSTWPKDEELLVQASIDFDKYVLIIAPHEINENHLKSLEQILIKHKTIRFSQLDKQNNFVYPVLIIDNIGMLSSIYKYGSIAFIGGGFGKGIHNILEAATFGLPVLFGPNYFKFTEAKELLEQEGAFVIKNTADINEVFEKLNNYSIYNIYSSNAREYVQTRMGASQKIFSELFAS